MEKPPKRKTRTSSAVKDRYNSKAYDDIKVRVKKGEKALIQKRAEQEGKSLNSFIVDCISGKKTGMYLAGASKEVTKMLKLFDPATTISYIDLTTNEISKALPADLIKLIEPTEKAYIQILI